MITISDVANLAGVSVATVSNVINQNGKVKPETVAKVQKAIEESGYIPNYIAKSLKTSQSKTIGVVVEEITSFNTPKIIDGICKYCDKNGYSVNLCDLRTSSIGFSLDRFSASLNTLLASRVAGLIYVGASLRNIGSLPIPERIPTVYAYCQSDSENYSVNFDNYDTVLAAVDYLADKGHTRIGILCGFVNQSFVHQRMLAFQTALMNRSLPFEPTYVKAGEWNFEKAKKCTAELLSLPKPPTALFAMNDVMACAAIAAASERGARVPDDLSVIGFDNREFSLLCTPSITTIEIPLKEIGYTAAETLLSVMKNGLDSKEEHDIVLGCKLVERKSVKRVAFSQQ